MSWTKVVFLGASIGFAALAFAQDPVTERHEMMEATREALKPMVRMVRGERDFDAAVVTSGIETMQHTAGHFGALFPEGSQSEESEARPEVWTDREGFDAALADFAAAVEEAVAAAPGDVESLQASLSAITRTCKGCHDKYRLEDE